MAESPAEAPWGERAERLLRQALADLQNGIDPLPVVSAAETALRIGAGELPASEMVGYAFPDEEETGCICPADLLERGGFRGGCPVHHQRPGGSRG